MGQHKPDTELLMAAHGALPGGGVERLARAVADLDGLMLAPHVARLRDAAAAYLAAPSGTAAQALMDALAGYVRVAVPQRPAAERRTAGVSRADMAALADEGLPAWTGRADLQ